MHLPIVIADLLYKTLNMLTRLYNTCVYLYDTYIDVCVRYMYICIEKLSDLLYQVVLHVHAVLSPVICRNTFCPFTLQ